MKLKVQLKPLLHTFSAPLGKSHISTPESGHLQALIWSRQRPATRKDQRYEEAVGLQSAVLKARLDVLASSQYKTLEGRCIMKRIQATYPALTQETKTCGMGIDLIDVLDDQFDTQRTSAGISSLPSKEFTRSLETKVLG